MAIARERSIRMMATITKESNDGAISASLTHREFEAIFTPDKPVVFNFHGYPWLIHRLTYRRPGQHNIHVRG